MTNPPRTTPRPLPCAGAVPGHEQQPAPDGLPPAAARPALRMTAADLAADPAAVAVACRCARAALAGRGLAAITDTCEVIVSELVTNAIRAAADLPGPGGTRRHVRLRVTALDPGPGARVEVWDPSTDAPVPATPGPDSDSGRGLLIVAALSARWGWQPAEGGGKRTWAEITP